MTGIPEIAHEKTEVELRERIGSFSKECLKHIEPQEKTVLPTEEGTLYVCYYTRVFPTYALSLLTTSICVCVRVCVCVCFRERKRERERECALKWVNKRETEIWEREREHPISKKLQFAILALCLRKHPFHCFVCAKEVHNMNILTALYCLFTTVHIQCFIEHLVCKEMSCKFCLITKLDFYAKLRGYLVWSTGCMKGSLLINTNNLLAVMKWIELLRSMLTVGSCLQ